MSWSRNRNSDLRLRGAGGEKNINGSATLSFYMDQSRPLMLIRILHIALIIRSLRTRQLYNNVKFIAMFNLYTTGPQI
jgi:hypothetical protein